MIKQCRNVSKNKPYYKLPLEFSKITNQESFEKCSIKDSIEYFVHLIVSTQFGECTFDEDFGCVLWENDFLTMNDEQRKSADENIKEFIEESIRKREKRLSQVVVEAKTYADEKIVKGPEQDERILKKRFDVSVTGNTIKGHFEYKTSFYIAPLSYQ